MTQLTRVFDDLIRFEIELWNAVNERLRGDLGLPLGRFQAMEVIARLETCRIHDIAADMVITVGGASKLVDRIEASGHCTRRPNPDDRRSSLITLTLTGSTLLAAATACVETELQHRIGSVLPPLDLQQLGTSLAQLRSALHATTTP